MVSPYSAASAKVLDEIIREAEARLEAQLTLGVAADQRAMTLASFLATLDAAVITLWAMLGGSHPWPLAIMTIGFALAALPAMISARPVAWDLPGNVPSSWRGDIERGDSLHESRSAMAAHYDDMIERNARIMALNGRLIRASLVAVLITLAAAGVAIGVVG